MDELARLFCELVRIDSESGSEGEFLTHAASLFRHRLDAECTLGDDGNLIARVCAMSSETDEPILLSAHADTVRPGVGIEPVVEEGVVRSGGDTILGADDKAAIAEILVALETAERRPQVEVVITHGEEIGLLGAKALDPATIRSRFAFVFDTSDLRSIIVGGPTYIAVDIEIVGRSAHAGLRPSEGISAITVAAEAITKIKQGQVDENTTVNIGTIGAGTVRNAVPDKATLQAECRSFDHAACLRQAEGMKAVFECAAANAGASAEISIRIDYEAASLSEASPAVRLAKAALEDVGLVPDVKTLLGGTDAIVFQSKGIDAVVMGYGGRQAHSTSEHIAIADMAKACEIIRCLLGRAAVSGWQTA